MSSSTNPSDSIVIVAAKRTPMGGMRGALSGASATELGSVAIAAALADVELDTAKIDEVYFGNVVSAGLKQAPARQASLGAGIPNSVPCTTISKVCGSGMKAVMIARDQIAAGNADIVLAGGMESMSNTPYLLPKARAGMRMGHGQVLDSLFLDGLEDVETGGPMGSFGQATADQYDVSREAMDAFAIESLARAQHAIDNSHMQEEIAPVTIATRTGEQIVAVDEQPGNARPEKIPNLKPAFKADGTVTAANSSSMSDGAAAVLLMRKSTAAELGLEPMARLIAQASHAQAPNEFCLAPVGAIRKVLEKADWQAKDVDLFEINEAFAVVTMLAIDHLGLEAAKVNVHGGACALGHPLGASGARLIVTLIHALRRTSNTTGVASLCIGGGEATAVALELL